MPTDRPRLALAVSLPALVALAGCASTTPSPVKDGTVQTPVRLGGGGFGNAEVRTTTTTTTETARVDGAPEKAYEALLGAFAVLTITPNNLSPSTFTVAAVDTRVRRRLGREPLSLFLNCGENMQTGPNADTYDVVLSVQSRVVPVPGEAARSTLATVVTATARPTVSSGNTLTCSSTGMIERRLVQNVQAQLSRTP